MPKSRTTLLFEREREIRTLKNSLLVRFEEYQSMLGSIEQYHNETKLSSVQLKKHSNRELEMRPYLYDNGDTFEKPFFGILTKMMLEINRIKNQVKQLEDLQKVHQWFKANKPLLCQQTHFGDDDATMKDKSHLENLPYRPASSMDTSSKSGVLRYIRWQEAQELEKSHHSLKTTRPYTAEPGSRCRQRSIPRFRYSPEPRLGKNLLTVKSLAGIKAPCVTDNFEEYESPKRNPYAKSPRRPKSSPSVFVLDDSFTDSFTQAYMHGVGKKECQTTRSSHVKAKLSASRVNVHYGSELQNNRSLHVRVPSENNVSNGIASVQESPGRNFTYQQRSKSAEDFTKERRRVMFDLDVRNKGAKEDREYNNNISLASKEQCQVILNQQMLEERLLEEQNELLEKEYIIEEEKLLLNMLEKDKLDRNMERDKLDRNVPSSNVDNQQLDDLSHNAGYRYNTTHNNTTHNQPFNVSVNESDKSYYIPSYSKLQQRSSLTQDNVLSSSHLPSHVHPRHSFTNNVLSSTQLPTRHSRTSTYPHLKKKNVEIKDVLEMATPIGQHMKEERESMMDELPPGFRHPSLPIAPQTTPQTTPEGPSQVDVSAYFDSDSPDSSRSSSNSTIGKADIQLEPEDRRSWYNVHFPQEKENNNERHYKASGPVEPDSIRYQYTDDGFGNRTYMKRITKKDQLLQKDIRNRLSKGKMIPKNSVPVQLSNGSRDVNTKTLASLMIIKHLGREDKTTSDRFSGRSSAMPVLVPSEQEVNYIPYGAMEYIKFTRSLDNISDSSNRGTTPSRSLKHLDVKLPGSNEKEKGVNASCKIWLELGDGDLKGSTATDATNEKIARKLLLASEEKDALSRRPMEREITIDSEGKPLKARGRALAIGGKNSTGEPILSRPSSARSQRGDNNLSVKHSRSRSTSPAGRLKKDDEDRESVKSEHTFEVKHFKHYCFDDNPVLEEDYQVQRETNAAVNIQRIFRGYKERQYIKQRDSSEKERQRKAAISLQKNMRGFLVRKRLMEQNVEKREPTIASMDYARDIKADLQKKEEQRKQKKASESRKLHKKQMEDAHNLKKVTATGSIFQMFHARGPTKAQTKAAAITIQRHVRGWLCRRYFGKAKTKAMKRSLDVHGFMNQYRSHLERVMKRYGTEKPQAVLRVQEFLKYIERRNKYDVEFDRLSKDKTITHKDLTALFAACGQFPSRIEIEDAIKVCIEGLGNPKEHKYTKAEAVEIAFHIYVPKGTGIKEENIRKSTWMNPIIGGDEALQMALNKKVIQDTNLSKVFELLSSTKLEQQSKNTLDVNQIGIHTQGTSTKMNVRPSSSRSTGSQSPCPGSRSPNLSTGSLSPRSSTGSRSPNPRKKISK